MNFNILILENLREIIKKLGAMRLESVTISCGTIMTTAANKAQILRQQAAKPSRNI